MSSAMERYESIRRPGLRAWLRRRPARWWAAVAGLMAVAALSAWTWWRLPRGPLVIVAPVRAAPLTVSWSATGYVECRTAQIAAPQVGRIVSIEVREGDRVRRGQVLARLESESVAAVVRAEEEGVRIAQAQAEAARHAYEQAAATYRHQVAQAQAQVAAARARWLQAQANLDRSRRVAQANLATARAEADAAWARAADIAKPARPEEIAEALAAFVAAEATAVRARAEKARQERLLAQEAVPPKAVEDAADALARAEAALASARERLALLRQGGRADQIAAAQAQARAAEQAAAAAAAQLQGLDAEERAVEEAAAQLRTAEAALAEALAARARVEAAAQEARAAEARVNQSAAGARQALATLSERVITAPFTGMVGRRFMDPGDIAQPGSPIFSLVEADRPWVAAEVDAQDLAGVRPRQRVTITVPAYPGRAFPGVVALIGPEAIPQTEVRTGARVVRVRISLDRVPAAERGLLKPGMEVDAAGNTVLVRRALLVPNDAIQTDAAGPYVLVLEGERVDRRRVKTGFIGARETEVLSGLRVGERVVVSGAEGLQPGDRVRVR